MMASLNRTWILCRNLFINKGIFRNFEAMKKPVRNYRVVGDHKINTMDDLPFPCGPWYQLYYKNNSKYNIKLLLGAAHFLFWFGIFCGTDIVRFNYKQPCFDLLDCRDKPKSK